MDGKIKELFEQFLIENDCYSQYLTNLWEDRRMTIDDFDKYLIKVYCGYDNFIISHCIWDATEEGHNFWERIHEEWLERYKMLKSSL